MVQNEPSVSVSASASVLASFVDVINAIKELPTIFFIAEKKELCVRKRIRLRDVCDVEYFEYSTYSPEYSSEGIEYTGDSSDIIILLILFLASSACAGEEVLEQYGWNISCNSNFKLSEDSALPTGSALQVSCYFGKADASSSNAATEKERVYFPIFAGNCSF